MGKEKKRSRFTNTTGPLYVMLDITTACNFKCLHCYNNSGKKDTDEMTDEEITDVVKQIADMHPESVCLCGGETMLRSNIYELIKILKPNVGAVNMVSNGSLLNKNNILKLKEAGINAIQISVDGINAMQHDTFRQYVGSFDKAINAIKMIHAMGIEVYVSFVPNKLNHRSVIDYFELMSDLGVNTVRIMPLIPMGRGSLIEKLMLEPNEYAELQLAIELNKVKYSAQHMGIEWGDPLDHIYRLPNNESYGFKNMQYEIKANGNITISAYLPIVVGNVRKHSLKEYWENGYDNIWYTEDFKKYRDQIHTIYDINKLWANLGNESNYYIDIMHDMKAGVN